VDTEQIIDQTSVFSGCTLTGIMWALGATVLTEVIKGVTNHIQNSAAPEPLLPLYHSKPEPFENRQYQTTSQRTAENYQHTSKR